VRAPAIRLIHVESTVSDELGYDLLGFFYECDVVGGELKPDLREISGTEWVSWPVALERITDPFLRPAVSIASRSFEDRPACDTQRPAANLVQP